MKNSLRTLIFSLAFLIAPLASAENSQAVGDYMVHFNALSTESLPPSVAKAYGIKRSKNTGLLNVSVLKKGGSFQGVEADIEVHATNLTGQLRKLPLRKITEQQAVYYIGEFSVAHRETLDFDIKVTTADNNTGNMSLRQQFFTN